MPGLAMNTERMALLANAIRDEVAAFLTGIFSGERGAHTRLDRWTQLRVTEENLAKIALVTEAADPVEHCYQDLVREIDSEAASGVFLVNSAAYMPMLRGLATEAGISGELHRNIEQIAPLLFADELRHSDDEQDLVWVSIQARFDRANLDARISEITMAHLVDDEDNVKDMTDAMRSLLYTYHEYLVRRRCSLPLILEERNSRELVTIVSQLAERGGDYGARVNAISERASAM